MKAKRISTGEEVEVSELTFTSMKTGVVHRRDIKNGGFIAESDLEFLPDTPEEVTIEGWVARDKGGGLYLHHSEPTRGTYEWYSVMCPPRPLPTESFPSVTWESEPLKVKLTITPIE